MTINLFDVDEALSQEEKKQARLERALEWKFRGWYRVEPEPEEPSSGQESGSPEEAR